MIETRRGSLLCTALLLLACGNDEPTEGEGHVANARELTAVETWRVGSVDDPEAGFTHVGGVAVDVDNSTYVLETLERQVRVYDDRGSLVRRFGRQGEGPGEFKSPMLVGLRHDTLAIADPDQGRLTLFLRTGELLQSIPSPPVWLEPLPGTFFMVVPVQFTETGFRSRIVRTMSAREVPRDSFSVPHVTLDRTGQVADTIRSERWSLYSPEISTGSLRVRIPSGPPAGPLYFDGAQDTWIVERPVASDAENAAFTVTRIAPLGDTVYRRSYQYEPVEYTAAHVDKLVAQAVRPHLRKPEADSATIAATVRQALSLPPYQPPIRRGNLGADHSLWLQLHDDGSDRDTWIVIDPDGRLQGRVSFPRDAAVHWTDGDQAVVVTRDDLDVPWLIRYRLAETS